MGFEMNEWICRWMNGFVDGWMDLQMDGWIYRWINRFIYL